MSTFPKQRTEHIYKTIMDRLITEIKEDVLNEGCNEDLLKDLKSVSI
jgi:hypothetical protein